MQTGQSLKVKDTNILSKPHKLADLQATHKSQTNQTPSTALIQRATADMRSLSRAEILQLQRMIGNREINRLVATTASQSQRQAKRNTTGLPDNLKARIESLSGVSLDSVKVHFNSAKPYELKAFAYTQGTDIHIAPGQEKYLPHEAWHVVQQAQGRVRPTMQMQDGVGINNDHKLEREADHMGTKANMPASQLASDENPAHLRQDRFVPAAAVPAHPLSWVTQLVNFPKDSTGTIDKNMAKIEKDGKMHDVTGAEIQDMILKWAWRAGEKPGGYRLGSYALDEKNLLEQEAFRFTRDEKYEKDEEHGMPALPKDYARNNIDAWITLFIMKTLFDAEQVQYIQENADTILKTHKVIVDVDCQFDRRGRVIFHKDSRGTTVFVNLTFNNKAEMQGPESYEDVEGDPGLEDKLPEETKKDIEERRNRRMGYPGGIKAPQLPAYGRISFSDPNLYHSTPLMERRQKLKGTESKKELITLLRDQFGEPEETLTQLPKKTLSDWALFHLNPFNSHGFEELSERKDTNYAKTLATAKRNRRLSSALEMGKITQEELDQQAETPRTFIRTWVRFVPK